MISANTILNIIDENGIDSIKGSIPNIAYQLIKKKYVDNKDELPYLKKIIKSYEQKKKDNENISKLDIKKNIEKTNTDDISDITYQTIRNKYTYNNKVPYRNKVVIDYQKDKKTDEMIEQILNRLRNN